MVKDIHEYEVVMSKDGSCFCEEKHGLAYFPYGVILEDRHQLSSILEREDVKLFANKITFNTTLEWNSSHDFILFSEENVIFGSKANIISNGEGSLIVKAGFGEDGSTEGKIIFDEGARIRLNGRGECILQYNPEAGTDNSHKYTHPMGYFTQVFPPLAVKAYMMVNNIYDLQNIRVFLNGNYALSRDIDASITVNWNEGKGFLPLAYLEEKMPFTGNFDGNNFSINNLFVSRSNEHMVGLFAYVIGAPNSYQMISNILLNNASIRGDHYVGGIVGAGEYFSLSNVRIKDSNITGRAVVGGLGGSIRKISIAKVGVDNVTVDSEEFGGRFFGAIEGTDLNELCSQCSDEAEEVCLGISINGEYE